MHKKYYLETNALYTLINKLDIIKSSGIKCFTSAYALQELVYGIEEKDYIIAQYGDGWSYKTHVDGEKVFIISNELKTLKEKVKAKHLPLD